MAGLSKHSMRIGQAVYEVHQMPFGESRPLFWLGASILAPVIEAAEGLDFMKLLSGEEDALEDPKTLAALGRAFKIFFDRASGDDFERFESAFAGKTFVKTDGAKSALLLTDVRELHWPSAGYSAFLKWFVFCVKVNFFPFSLGAAQGAGGSHAPSTP